PGNPKQRCRPRWPRGRHCTNIPTGPVHGGRSLTSTYIPSRSVTLYGFSFGFRFLSATSVSISARLLTHNTVNPFLAANAEKDRYISITYGDKNTVIGHLDGDGSGRSRTWQRYRAPSGGPSAPILAGR